MKVTLTFTFPDEFLEALNAQFFQQGPADQATVEDWVQGVVADREARLIENWNAGVDKRLPSLLNVLPVAAYAVVCKDGQVHMIEKGEFGYVPALYLTWREAGSIQRALEGYPLELRDGECGPHRVATLTESK
jgi:hypothetical protein